MMGRVLTSMARGALATLALAVLYAGAAKAADPAALRQAILLHGLVPAGAVGPTVVALPAVEMMVAALALTALMTRRHEMLACVAMAALWMVLSAYALLLVFDPPDAPAPCGCGYGTKAVVSWAPIVARNSAAAAGTLVLGAFLRTQDAPRRRHCIGTPARAAPMA